MSNYPTSKDNLSATNATPNQSMVQHAESYHNAERSAIDAVQNALGTTGSPGSLLAAYVGGVITPSGDTTGTKDGAAIQAALNAGGVAIIEGASIYWATNLNLPTGSKILALAPLGDFTNPGWNASAVIKQPAGGSSVIIAMEQGSELEGVTIDGNAIGQVAVDANAGFECRMKRVRIVNCATTGLLFNSANNIHFDDVYVDSCGSATAAAVQVRSFSTTSITNVLNLFGLTIENSTGVDLDLAAGNGTTNGNTDYIEFVRIFGLHLEGGGGAYPVLSVGNIRAVDLVAPLLVGNPSQPVVLYDQQLTTVGATTVQGGLNIIGGAVIGNATAPANLIHLQAGDKFTIDGGTLLQGCSDAAIQIDSTFGATVNVGDHGEASIGSLYNDARTGGKIKRTVPADSGWIAPTLAGTWVNSGAFGTAAAGYRMLANGDVELQGQVTTGSGTIFTLPAGYRPGKNKQFPIIAAGVTFGALEVDSSGAVTPIAGSNPINLENVKFYAEL